MAARLLPSDSRGGGSQADKNSTCDDRNAKLHIIGLQWGDDCLIMTLPGH